MIDKVVDRANIRGIQYDLFISSVDFESRCLKVPEMISNDDVRDSLLLYRESPNCKATDSNKNYFLQIFPNSDYISLRPGSDIEIYKYFRSNYRDHDSHLKRILIDYSCMPSFWYNSIFNWFEYSAQCNRMIVDFVYSMGSYKGSFSPLTIQDILPLPGCEGSTVEDRNRLACLSLGYDGSVATSVRERLEPDDTLTFIASPGSTESAEEKAAEANEKFLGTDIRTYQKVNLYNIIEILNTVYEAIGPFLGRKNITLVPLGPKPITLAFILLSRTFTKTISCLTVEGDRSPPSDIEATGDLNISRVILSK